MLGIGSSSHLAYLSGNLQTTRVPYKNTTYSVLLLLFIIRKLQGKSQSAEDWDGLLRNVQPSVIAVVCVEKHKRCCLDAAKILCLLSFVTVTFISVTKVRC